MISGDIGIFFLNEIKHDDIPFWLLLTTPCIVVLAIPIVFLLYHL